MPSTEYHAVHLRIRTARGRAAEYECVRCPRQAQEWARVHTESGLDLWADYVPLCRWCHRKYDHQPETLKHGEENKSAKITEEDVLRIRRLHAAKTHTMSELAEMHNISLTQVHRIVHRQRWAHVKEEG